MVVVYCLLCLLCGFLSFSKSVQAPSSLPFTPPSSVPNTEGEERDTPLLTLQGAYKLPDLKLRIVQWQLESSQLIYAPPYGSAVSNTLFSLVGERTGGKGGDNSPLTAGFNVSQLHRIVTPSSRRGEMGGGHRVALLSVATVCRREVDTLVGKGILSLIAPICRSSQAHCYSLTVILPWELGTELLIRNVHLKGMDLLSHEITVRRWITLKLNILANTESTRPSFSEVASKDVTSGGGPTPSKALLKSGLFDPQHPCATAAWSLAQCVHQKETLSECRPLQQAYMDCQRTSVLGGTSPTPLTTGDSSSKAESGSNRGAPMMVDHRFSHLAEEATTRGSVALGASAVTTAASLSGLGTNEVEALCSALGEGDCPVQTMTNMPLPIGGGLTMPSLGPFGPDLSAIAGLVLGAIINGIIGPEIIEMVQTFGAKIMKMVPPVLRKVLVDGVDPLSSLPPMPNIPDPAAIMEEAMAQVQAAKAIALGQLERAKAALALARSEAQAALAKVKDFQNQMKALYAALSAQLASELATARAMAAAAKAAALQGFAMAQQAYTQALEQAKSVVALARQQLADFEHQAGAGLTGLKAGVLGQMKQLFETTGNPALLAHNLTEARKLLPELSAVFASINACNASVTAAAGVLEAKQATLDAIGGSSPSPAEAEVLRSHQATFASVGALDRFAALQNISDSALQEVAASGSGPVDPAQLTSGQRQWTTIRQEASKQLDTAQVAAATMKAAAEQLSAAEEQERLALEESAAVRRVIHEEEALATARLGRIEADKKKTMVTNVSFVELAQRDPTDSQGGRRGILAVILHYELSHALTTALTLAMTQSFTEAMVPQLHDLLVPHLTHQLHSNLPEKIAVTVASALEASLPRTVPPLLERALPGYVSQACTTIVTRIVTEAVGQSVVHATGAILLHPPEERACCQQCRLTGERGWCSCCAGTDEQDAASRKIVQQHLKSIAAYYSDAALSAARKAAETG